MKPIKTKAPIAAVGLFLVAYLVPQLAGLRINFSTSMPRGLYRNVASAVKRDAIVAVCLPEELARFGVQRHYLGAGSCPDGSEPVVKVIAAVGSDRVEVTANAVLVNGIALPHSRPLDRDRGGRDLLPYAAGEHRLESGEVWLYSPYEERSWDSRYFGPVGIENVTTLVEPLATFR